MGNQEDIVCHIFLQHFPAEYHNILVAKVEKLSTMADNMADLASQSTALILSV